MGKHHFQLKILVFFLAHSIYYAVNSIILTYFMSFTNLSLCTFIFINVFFFCFFLFVFNGDENGVFLHFHWACQLNYLEEKRFFVCLFDFWKSFFFVTGKKLKSLSAHWVKQRSRIFLKFSSVHRNLKLAVVLWLC